MKTVRKTLIALVALVVFASCSKKTDDVVPAPTTPPAAELAGAYNVTAFSYNGSPQSTAGHVITVKFGYIADNKVVVLVTDSNDPTIDEDYGNMDVTWVNRSIEIRNGSVKMGTYENGALELDLKEDSDTIHLTAKRQ